MDNMYVEDAREDIDSVVGAIVASFAELIAKEDYNDESVESSAITNVCIFRLIEAAMTLLCETKCFFVSCVSVGPKHACLATVENL